MENFKPELMKEVILKLAPENMRLYTQSIKIKDKCDQTEKIYQMEYSQKKFTEKQLKLMMEPNPINQLSKQTLGLPDKNVFLPKNLEVLDAPHLQQIKISDQSTLFYQFNNEFQVPQAFIKASIYTDDYDFSNMPAADILLAIYQSIFKEHFKPTMYLAEMANLKMKFSFGNHRVILEFGGYNESLI